MWSGVVTDTTVIAAALTKPSPACQPRIRPVRAPARDSDAMMMARLTALREKNAVCSCQMPHSTSPERPPATRTACVATTAPNRQFCMMAATRPTSGQASPWATDLRRVAAATPAANSGRRIHAMGASAMETSTAAPAPAKNSWTSSGVAPGWGIPAVPSRTLTTMTSTAKPRAGEAAERGWS